MKILITGGAGFVAPWLQKELQSNDHEVVVTARNSKAHSCDLSVLSEVEKLLNDVQPDALIHMAGLSSPARVAKDPYAALQSNILTTTQLALALSEMEKKISILFTSTGMVFKPTSDMSPYSEGNIPNPQNPYASMKLACEQILLSLKHYGHKVWIARPFNHTGAGQTVDFACAAFADKIAKSPLKATVETGPLEAVRDFSDVRDIVRAYRMILEKQPEEEVFHLGSGRGQTIGEIFEGLVRVSKKDIAAQPSGCCPSLAMIADVSRAKKVLEWTPEYTMTQTLNDIYSFYDQSK